MRSRTFTCNRFRIFRIASEANVPAELPDAEGGRVFVHKVSVFWMFFSVWNNRFNLSASKWPQLRAL